MSRNQNDYFNRFVEGSVPRSIPVKPEPSADENIAAVEDSPVTVSPQPTPEAEIVNIADYANADETDTGITAVEDIDSPHFDEPETLAVTIEVENRPQGIPAEEVLEEISAAMAGVLRFENIGTDGENYTAEIQINGPVSSPLPGILALGNHPSYGEITVRYEVDEDEETPEFDLSEEPEIEGLLFSITREDGVDFQIVESAPVINQLVSAVAPVIGEHSVQAVEAGDGATLYVTLRPAEEGTLDPRILTTGIAEFRGTLSFPHLGAVTAAFVSGV